MNSLAAGAPILSRSQCRSLRPRLVPGPLCTFPLSSISQLRNTPPIKRGAEHRPTMANLDEEEGLLRGAAGPSTSMSKHSQSHSNTPSLSLSRVTSRVPSPAGGSRRSSGEQMRKFRSSEDGKRPGTSSLRASRRGSFEDDTVCERDSSRTRAEAYAQCSKCRETTRKDMTERHRRVPRC